MARSCTICRHSQREQINQALVAGMVQLQVAERWKVSKDSVSRHVLSNHVPRNVIMGSDAPSEEDEPILDRLQELIGFARSIMKRAQETNQLTAAINAVRELARIFELMARLTGQLDEGGTRVNVLIQQQQQREAVQEAQLSRLTVEERRQLRYLYAKMQGELPAPGVIDGNRAAQPLARSD